MKISNLQQNSYIPYSGKSNVAVTESINGRFYPGVRVENIAFPLTVSAVQNAVFCCLSEGETPQKLCVKNEPDSLISYWVEEYNLQVEPLENYLKNEFTNVFLKNIDIQKTLKSLLKKALIDNSQFPVSCLLKTDMGYMSGVNIENKNWSCGLCAERVAVSKAISYGVTHFEEMHICAEQGEYCSPCGACRQVLVEHLPNEKIYLYHPDGTKSVHYSSDLLPYSFQSSSLKK